MLLGRASLGSWLGTAPRTRYTDPMLSQCWSSVYDAGPTLSQNWVSVSCLPGARGQICVIPVASANRARVSDVVVTVIRCNEDTKTRPRKVS